MVLSRGAAAAGPDPLAGLTGPLVVNREGSVGACPPGAPGICLGVAEGRLDALSPRVVAASLANNHAGDVDAAATAAALSARGILALDEEGAPHLLAVGGSTWALVPLRVAGRRPDELQLALERARAQLLLARAHTPLVAALPHWGTEGARVPDALQERLDPLLRAWGAAVVAGHGAHARQEARCHADGASFLGLGDLLFDRARAEGAVASCAPAGPRLTCSLRATRAGRRFAPVLGEELARCEVELGEPVDPSWTAHPGRELFRSVEPFPAACPSCFLAFAERWSRQDREVALRPLVFRVEGGRAMDVWRGTSLAWPTVAARTVRVGGEQLLCALHRADSYLDPDPGTLARHRAVYRWAGSSLGFVGGTAAEARRICEPL